MHTPSSRSRAAKSAESAAPQVQKTTGQQPEGDLSQPIAYDLSQLDLFSHAPKRASNQAPGIQRNAVSAIATNPAISHPSDSNLVQAKLMTSKELSQITGVDRRSPLTRGFKALGGFIHIGKGGSSYDDILGLLQDYETLSESDPQGTQKAKRLNILTTLEAKVFAWYNSSSRQKSDAGEVVASSEGDKKKVQILQELLYEVVGERDAVAAMSDTLESGIAKTKGITGMSESAEAQNPAEQQAQVVQVEQKSFWSTAGEKISKAWHRTFGNEFYPTAVIPVHTDFLSEYDIRRSVELIEVAMEVERNLIAEGVEPLKAVALAYQYLPNQLRPLSPAPEEKVVLKVKLQIFRESLAQKQADEASRLEQAQGVVEGAGSLSSGYGGSVEALETVKAITKDVAENHSGINDIVGSVTEVVSSFVNIFMLLDKSTDAGVSKTEQSKNEEKAGIGALAILEKLYGLGDKVNALVSGADASPLLGVLSSVVSIIQNLIKGAQLLIRYYQEGKLNSTDDARQSGLLGALIRTAQRGRNLAISAGTEIIISALEIASAILGPSGIAGGVITGLAKIIKYGKKAVEQLEASYTAGLAQESQLEAESGISGSAKKVLESSDKWGLTAIVLEAKDGNAIAVKKLELYGVKPEDIQSMAVKDIRKFIMEELEREENAKTLTQKITRARVVG